MSASPRAASAIAPAFALALAAQAPPHFELVPVRTVEAFGGVASAAAFAPNGTEVCTGGELGDVVMTDVRTRERRWIARTGTCAVGAIVFTPDGNQVAALGSNLSVRDTATGVERWRLPAISLRALAIAPDGRRLAFSPLHGEIAIVATADGRETTTIHFGRLVAALAFARDGRSLFVGDAEGKVDHVFAGDVSRDRWVEHAPDARGRRVACRAIDYVGDDLVSFGTGGDIVRADRVYALRSRLEAAAIATAADLFAAGSSDGFVRWWTDGGRSEHLMDVGSPVTALALHPTGALMLVATRSGALRLFADGVATAELPTHARPVQAAAFAPDGSAVAVTGDRLQLCPLPAGPPVVLGACASVCSGRGATELLALEADRLVARDARTGALLATFDNLDCARHLCAASPDGVVIGGGGFLAPARRWDLAAGTHRGITGCPEWIHGVAFAPDGRCAIAVAASGEGESGRLIVLDRDSERLLDEHRVGGVEAVAFLADGTQLLCAIGAGGRREPVAPRLEVLDARTWTIVREVPARVLWWRALDDRTAIAHDGVAFTIWDASRLEPLQPLPLPKPTALPARIGAIRGADLAAASGLLAVTRDFDVEVLRVERRQ